LPWSEYNLPESCGVEYYAPACGASCIVLVATVHALFVATTGLLRKNFGFMRVLIQPNATLTLAPDVNG